MKISKKVREEAAWFCAIGASTGWRYGYPFSQDAKDLAIKAENHCRNSVSRWEWPTFCAEAEALLRTGWSPK